MLDRRGHDAVAVEGIGKLGWGAPEAPKEGFSVIPMWVADMNFKAAPVIPEALIRRAEHPSYGYFADSDEYFAAIANWQRVRNGVEGLTRREIGYENGVLGAVASAIRAFTAPGEKILVHAPTYIGFTHTLEDTGRVASLSYLKRDEQGVWRMDFEDMERRLLEEDIHFAIFCSPHNPCGRVWERWELERAMELFRKYEVVVVSDEIWSDLLLHGHHHIPTQSISEDARNRTIAVYAPSKTFNLAGLIGSYHIVYSPYLRSRLLRESGATHYNEMNVLSMHALIAAYGEGGQEWCDELCEVLSDNIDLGYEFFTKQCSGISAMKPEGTYMLLLDLTDYCKKSGRTIAEVIKAGWDVGVGWQEGEPFHLKNGIRMNFALPRHKVEEALERLRQYVFV